MNDGSAQTYMIKVTFSGLVWTKPARRDFFKLIFMPAHNLENMPETSEISVKSEPATIDVFFYS